MIRTRTAVALVPLLGTLAAATSYSGRAEAKRIVAVLMDRSGSMASNGSGGPCGTTDRKWVCGVNGVKNRIDGDTWAADNSDDFYYFKFSTRFPGFIFEQGDVGVTAPLGPVKYLGGPFMLPDADGTIGKLL